MIESSPFLCNGFQHPIETLYFFNQSQENEESLKQQQTSLQRKDEDTQTLKRTLPNGNGARIKSAKKSECVCRNLSFALIDRLPNAYQLINLNFELRV